MRQAYTSTVVAPIHLAVALVVGAAPVVLTAASGPLWLAAAVGVVMLATGLWLSVVRCALGPERVVAAPGLWGRGRVVATSNIADVSTCDLSWPQVFGLGVRTRWRTTRLTVRPGPTLCLRLRDGEIMRISIDDPCAALRVLSPAVSTRKKTS
jgi:hypothetical protein